MSVNRLPQTRQRELFLCVVRLEDQGVKPGEARALAADWFALDTEQVRRVIDRGVDEGWLDELLPTGAA